MKAIFDGQDYTLILDNRYKELQRLKKEKLEAQLVGAFTNGDLGKLVSLESANNNGCDGIELKYLPKDAGDWDAIQTIQVRINRSAYNYLRDRGKFGTRYNGSDKIEISNGDPTFVDEM